MKPFQMRKATKSLEVNGPIERWLDPTALPTPIAGGFALLQSGRLRVRFADNSGTNGHAAFTDLCSCFFATPRSARWRATELWVGKPERSCVDRFRLLTHIDTVLEHRE